jgi:DNA-binding XRE family transcriptional regulator
MQTLHLEGKAYVVVPREQYERLVTLSKAAELPPLPKPNAQGDYPAVAYACASIARSVIRDRVAAGLTQRELAQLAGIRVETLCRIETGKQIPSVPTIEKIDEALRGANLRKQKGR